MKKFKPEGQLISTEENKKRVSSAGALHDAFYSGAPVECRVLRCDAEHNLHVDLGCMKGIIPRCEGALGIEDGSVRDIALISRVNKPVVCAVTGFASTPEGENYALLSRRKVQQECADEYISTLRPGDVIPATVSHIEGFGVFCDIGAGINALMPIDGISVSRIPHRRRDSLRAEHLRRRQEHRLRRQDNPEPQGAARHMGAEYLEAQSGRDCARNSPLGREIRHFCGACSESCGACRILSGGRGGLPRRGIRQEHYPVKDEDKADNRRLLCGGLPRRAARILYHERPYRPMGLFA